MVDAVVSRKLKNLSIMKISAIKETNDFKLLAISIQQERFGYKFCHGNRGFECLADFNKVTNQLRIFAYNRTEFTINCSSWKACIKDIFCADKPEHIGIVGIEYGGISDGNGPFINRKTPK